MTLREQIGEDMGIFFDIDEFAESHMIDGKEMIVIIETDGLEQYTPSMQYADNLHAAKLLVSVRSSEFGAKPAVDTLIRVDKKLYRVIAVNGDLIYDILLEAMRG